MKKSLFLLIGIISILLLGTMMTGFILLWNKVSPPDPQAEFEEIKVSRTDQEKEEIRPFHTLDTFIVNLSDRGNTRYLRTSMVLELTSEEAVDEVIKRISQIRDIILEIIPSKKSSDIKTVIGKKVLAEEIMYEINYVLRNGSVTNIFFTEFVIQ